MNSCVYDKTDKGREEIATRKYQIPARMRTLLVLVDGRRPLESLLSNVAGLGLGAQHVDDLLAQQFIRLLPGSMPVATAPGPAAADALPASARARAAARQAARLAALPATSEDSASAEVEQAIDDAIASSAPIASAAAADPAEQFRQVYAFYNRNIKTVIGLRGVMLQLKVEKAVGLDELRELRTAFLQAAIKAKGGELALALREELDGMLGGAPVPDPVTVPAPGQARGGLDFFNMSNGAVEY